MHPAEEFAAFKRLIDGGRSIEDVAALLELTPAEVRGTASFYDMFHLEPVGRYLVAVCTNIACMLQGAYELLDHIEESLGVHPGGTTADGTFTLEDAECLALCGNAPCLTVNWRGWSTAAAACCPRRRRTSI